MILLAALVALAADPGLVPPAVEEAARATAMRPLAERMAAVTAPLLGVPYLLDPLGEGEGHDPDPIARYDGFDCQTFVEEALALSLALDPEDAGRVRASLRYGDGPIDYAHRRHFMELQWLPGNIAAGWIRMTTDTYGATTPFRQDVGPDLWARWRDRARFVMPDEALPTGQMALDVLPLAAAIEVAPRILPGSVVFVVREHRPGVPLWITHLGIVVAGADGRARLRHASTTAHVVKEEDLAAYLRRAAAWPGWPVAGIAVAEPLPQGPR